MVIQVISWWRSCGNKKVRFKFWACWWMKTWLNHSMYLKNEPCKVSDQSVHNNTPQWVLRRNLHTSQILVWFFFRNVYNTKWALYAKFSVNLLKYICIFYPCQYTFFTFAHHVLQNSGNYILSTNRPFKWSVWDSSCTGLAVHFADHWNGVANISKNIIC